MKIVLVKFVSAVRVPGRRFEEQGSARAKDGLQIEHGGGMVRLSYLHEEGGVAELRATVVPVANVEYMELAPEPGETKPAKGPKGAA